MPEPLSHPVGVLYEIRWKEICPWLILVRALRVTLLIRVLVLALLGTWLMHGGIAAIETLFPPTSKFETLALESTSSLSTGWATDRESIISLQDNAADQPQLISRAQEFKGPLTEGWQQISKPFLQMSHRRLSWLTLIKLLLYGVWSIVVWGIFGGAIARIAALYLTRGEIPGPIVAIRDATTVWHATVGAPLIALLFAGVLAVPLVLLGFLLRLDLFAVAAGLLWCFVLAWGLMLAAVLVGLLVGWPLMWACQGVERSDAFDGVSRCYAYVYQRPLYLIFFVVIASLLCLLGEAVVGYVTQAMVGCAEWTLSWGMGSARSAALLSVDWQWSSAPLATRAINGWKLALESVVASFPLACLWPMTVAIYLLLRRLIDATEMDEVALTDGSFQPGLPNLKSKESGVPEVERRTTNGNTNDGNTNGNVEASGD